MTSGSRPGCSSSQRCAPSSNSTTKSSMTRLWPDCNDAALWETELSDESRELQPQLGLLETTDTVHRPFVPTVFTLYPDLKIHSAYNGYWFWGRPTNAELAADLRAITRAIRSDWEVPAR